MECPQNFHMVAPGLYRSAQPTTDNFRWLAWHDFKTVVNLRIFNWDRWYGRRTNLTLLHISMKAWHPENEDAKRFLLMATDLALRPLLVHCRHGSDRTGSMVALYRMVVDGWTKDAALLEMLSPGHGFHKIWQDLVEWVQGVDINQYRKIIGLEG